MTRYELAMALLSDPDKLNEEVVVENGSYCGYLSIDEMESEEVKKTTEHYRSRTCDLYTDYVENDSSFDEDNLEDGIVRVTVIY